MTYKNIAKMNIAMKSYIKVGSHKTPGLVFM